VSISFAQVLQSSTFSSSGGEVANLRSKSNYPANTGTPLNAISVCQKRRDSNTDCRLLVVAADHSVQLFKHPGDFLWARQEALASIVNVEMIDLPVSEEEAAIEKEFGNKMSKFCDLIGIFIQV